MAKKRGGKATRKIGRDAVTGRFISIDKARRKKTGVVEIIKTGKMGFIKKSRKTAVTAVIDHHPPPKKKK